MNKTKKQRKQWWNSLTPEQQEDYIEHKQELKAKKRQTSPITNKYPEPIITAENRAEWEKKILSKNPWMTEKRMYLDDRDEMSSCEPLLDEDYQHMTSITTKDYTKGIFKETG